MDQSVNKFTGLSCNIIRYISQLDVVSHSYNLSHDYVNDIWFIAWFINSYVVAWTLNEVVYVCVCKSLLIFFFDKYHIHPMGLEPMISYSILCLQEEEVLFGPWLIGTNSLLLWIKIRLLLWSLVFYCCLLNHILCVSFLQLMGNA